MANDNSNSYPGDYSAVDCAHRQIHRVINMLEMIMFILVAIMFLYLIVIPELRKMLSGTGVPSYAGQQLIQ